MAPPPPLYTGLVGSLLLPSNPSISSARPTWAKKTLLLVKMTSAMVILIAVPFMVVVNTFIFYCNRVRSIGQLRGRLGLDSSILDTTWRTALASLLTVNGGLVLGVVAGYITRSLSVQGRGQPPEIRGYPKVRKGKPL